ncbi:SMP-30/gluconolactonase/LRE family protein [Micromonospora mirobrigensis]|uniref:Sugar lactone lactonase YvrE n=1 Tax=Micromonospora mirobrigensis TaxID=262898 RepID=A0A1C5AKJ4_9ACTN|nr:SMP-30/gluconolactonase/LRE family protein [Micromonospora mirobrigensis]SCF45719.1 Sugar lactone lactonase YvrE [Micromonospora mirobrigensis]
MHPELVVDARAALGEGPVWDDRAGVLYWVDILGQSVHVHDPSGEPDRLLPMGAQVGAVVPRQSGGLVAAVADGFVTLDDTTGEVGRLATVQPTGRDVRFNDGVCDPSGRFWAGTVALDQSPGAGTLYRLDPGATVTPALTGVTVSNGIEFTADGATMYYIDTPTRRIDAFDVVAGELRNRRTAVDLTDVMGVPDGLTLDAEGCLWVALWDGGAVHRYAPNGVLDRVVTFPVPRPTCPAFGGPDLTTLYVTSAAIGTDDPLSGALFAVAAGVAGRPVHRYRG